MADGTTINGVEARRIHRSNAQEVIDEAEDMLSYYRDRLLILAAMTPMGMDDGDGQVPWDFYVRREITDMWEEIQDEVIRAFLARQIVEFPEDCVDDYDEETA